MLNEPLSAQERLFAQRLVMLSGSLDRQRATDVAATLLTLDAASDRPVTLRLDCDGEDPSAALVLVDTLDLMRAPVHAVAAGRVTGAAVAVLAAAGSRTAMPHSRVLLCEPDLPTTTGAAEAVATIAEEHQRLLDAVCERIAAACQRSHDEVARDLRTKRWLSPEEAVDYGLVDAVVGGASG
jgi:ATP-dependent Clp protease protease subunit